MILNYISKHPFRGKFYSKYVERVIQYTTVFRVKIFLGEDVSESSLQRCVNILYNIYDGSYSECVYNNISTLTCYNLRTHIIEF